MEFSTYVILSGVIGVIVFTFFNMPMLYQLQIKEYKWSRLRASAQDDTGFWIPLKFPAKSLRNFLIMGIALLFTVVYYHVLYVTVAEFTYLYLLYWVLGTFAAKISLLIAMFITEPIAYLARERKIQIARNLVGNSNTIFIGITGSYGKTSVKDYLTEVLKSEKRVASTNKNNNTEVGNALSVISNLEEDTEYFVVEMGAYKLGEIKKATTITSPKYGIITGLGNQHVSLFGSRENLIKAKSELAAALPEDGTLYMNIDCEGWEEVLGYANCKVVKYSLNNSEEADVLGVVTGADSFEVRYGSNTYKYTHCLNGEHSILNLLGVIALSLDLGLQSMSIRDAVAALKPIDGKLSKIKLNSGVTIVDDSKNSNTQGFLAALRYTESLKSKYKYVFTKGILELGKSEKESSYQSILVEAHKLGFSILTTDRSLLVADTEGVVDFMNEDDMLNYLDKIDKTSSVLLEGRFSPNFMIELEKMRENEK